MSKYNLFIESGETFFPYKVDSTPTELPSGAYAPEQDPETGKVWFKKLKLNCDSIIDLPSTEYEYVTKQITNFLKPETKAKFQSEGFIYKRSVLLHGKPGTGKTILVNKVTQDALKNGAVVLFNPNPESLSAFYEALEATAPNKLTLVIFEEFDDLVAEGSRTEKVLLSILDGEIQKNNIIYLATTNHLDKVPLRMQRPGRFSSIVEVGFPSSEARNVYLTAKKVDRSLLSSWIDTTEGFSIDELKETVLAVKCLGESLSVVVDRVKDLKAKGLESESKDRDEEDDEDSFHSIIRSMAMPAKRRNR